MSLKDKLKALRDAAGRSQEETSRLLNVSNRAYSRWEKGLASPRLKNLMKIQKLYGKKLNFFLKDEAKEEALSDIALSTPNDTQNPNT